MFDIEGFLFRQFDNPRPYGSPQTDWAVDCPFCIERVGDDDVKHKLHISINKEVVHCFRCDYSRNWWKFVGDVLGTTNYVEIFSELYVVPSTRDVYGVAEAFYKLDEPVYQERDFSLPEDFQGLWVVDKTVLLNKARKYAKTRGFGKSHWLKYSWGVAQSIGWRLILPIEDDYWQARSLLKQNPKYLNPSSNPSSGTARYCIFNHEALHKYEEVVVCEGVFSASSIGANSIALIRKKATIEQADRLVESTVKRFILTVEAGAFPAMDILADRLRKEGKEVVLWCYDTGDPNDTEHPDKTIKYDLKSRVELLFNVN